MMRVGNRLWSRSFDHGLGEGRFQRFDLGGVRRFRRFEFSFLKRRLGGQCRDGLLHRRRSGKLVNERRVEVGFFCRDNLAVHGPRSVDFAVQSHRKRDVGPVARLVGSNRRRAFEIDQRGREIALQHGTHACVVQQDRVVRRDRDPLVEVLDGLFETVLRHPNFGQIVIGRAEGRMVPFDT